MATFNCLRKCTIWLNSCAESNTQKQMVDYWNTGVAFQNCTRMSISMPPMTYAEFHSKLGRTFYSIHPLFMEILKILAFLVMYYTTTLL